MSACAEFKPLVLKFAPNSQEWLEARRSYLGASDAAVVLGMSRWGSPAEVQRAKLESEIKEMNEAMERGHLLEPIVRRAYAEMFDVEVFPGEMFIHPEHQWMSATTDGSYEVTDGEHLLEIKTVNNRAFGSGEWGEDGTDGIPEYYLIQVMHQLAVTGKQACRLVALVAPTETLALLAGMAKSGADIRMLCEAVKSIGLHHFDIKRDDAMIADMIAAEGEWWQKHIIDEVPATDVAKLKDNGEILAATPEQAELIGLLREARDSFDIAEADVEKLTSSIKNILKDKSGIDAGKDLGRITWKKSKDTVSTVTDWEAVAVTMATETKLTDLFNSLVKANTNEVVKTGSRRFLCPRAWSKKEVQE
jgi:putative phage-type endonuclease